MSSSVFQLVQLCTHFFSCTFTTGKFISISTTALGWQCFLMFSFFSILAIPIASSSAGSGSVYFRLLLFSCRRCCQRSWCRFLIINENKEQQKLFFLVHCLYIFCNECSVQHNINTKKWKKLTWQCKWIHWQHVCLFLACLFFVKKNTSYKMPCRKVNIEGTLRKCVTITALVLWILASVWLFNIIFLF